MPSSARQSRIDDRSWPGRLEVCVGWKGLRGGLSKRSQHELIRSAYFSVSTDISHDFVDSGSDQSLQGRTSETFGGAVMGMPCYCGRDVHTTEKDTHLDSGCFPDSFNSISLSNPPSILLQTFSKPPSTLFQEIASLHFLQLLPGHILILSKMTAHRNRELY